MSKDEDETNELKRKVAIGDNLLMRCRFCRGEVVWFPEYNTPPLIRMWCEDCGDYTTYCQKCFLITDDPSHKCHFQLTLF